MNIVAILLLISLFVILTPGILVTLPQKGSKLTVAIAHGVVLALLYYLIHMFSSNILVEGLTESKPISQMKTSKEAIANGYLTIGPFCLNDGKKDFNKKYAVAYKDENSDEIKVIKQYATEINTNYNTLLSNKNWTQYEKNIKSRINHINQKSNLAKIVEYIDPIPFHKITTSSEAKDNGYALTKLPFYLGDGSNSTSQKYVIAYNTQYKDYKKDEDNKKIDDIGTQIFNGMGIMDSPLDKNEKWKAYNKHFSTYENTLTKNYPTIAKIVKN